MGAPGRQVKLDELAVLPARSEEFLAVPRSVGIARALACEFAEQGGAASAAVHAIRVAVTEAATNVVLHAYRHVHTPGRLRLDLAQRPAGAIDVVVGDRGIGKVPRVDSPGIGMGLPLIAHFADTLSLEHPDAGGTRLVMCFSPTGPSSE